MALDLADGLSYLHSKRIIHRDLTTANCMVRDSGQVVIVDFGLARVMEGETIRLGKHDDIVIKGHGRRRVRRVSTSAFLSPETPTKKASTRTMSIVGSPYNMAPEMMIKGSYGLKADIFSFGIILCEMIGRCEADPDVLPRTNSFGVDEPKFRCAGLPCRPSSRWLLVPVRRITGEAHARCAAMAAAVPRLRPPQAAVCQRLPGGPVARRF